MPSALIVGHRGQDGRILWAQLAEQGYRLIGLSHSGSDTFGTDVAVPPDLRAPGALRTLLEAFRPDRLYYLAAHHHSGQQAIVDAGALWRTSLDVHVQWFGEWLIAVREAGLATRIFYASSSRIFGQAETSPQSETTPYRPACVYGITKHMGMLLAEQHRRCHGMFVACGILFNHESPLRGSQFVTQRIAEGLVAYRNGGPKLRLGSLSARVDWGYAPDYTLAMQRMLDLDTACDFVIATGRTHAVGDFVQLAAERLGLQVSDCVIEDGSVLERPSQQLCGDYSRLKQATGWQPQTSFETLVHRMVDAALVRLT